MASKKTTQDSSKSAKKIVANKKPIAVQIEHLSKTYKNGVNALNDVSLTIEQGDFLALLGYNGAGKSTLIGVLTGLVNATNGKASIFGYDIATQSSLSKQMVGVVPQEFNFSIFEKVIDIVVNQGGYYGIPRDIALQRAEKILKQLELWEKRNAVSATLSGGMKRRLMIARALIHEPKLLILDEPTAGVDIELRRGMLEYLQKLHASGTTIILTTHYLEEAQQLCKTLAIIKDGSIIKHGNLHELIRGLNNQTYRLEIEALNTKKLKSSLISAIINNTTLEATLPSTISISQLVLDLSKENIVVTNIEPKENRLEELFISILQHK